MATFQEVMTALRNADAAGDTHAATRLAQIAQSMRAPKPAQVGPQGEDLTTGPMNPPAYEDQAPATKTKNEFGDVTGDLVEAPWSATKAFAKGIVDQSQSPTMQAMPEDWNPALKSIYARVGDTAMTGLSALGTAYAGAAGAIGEVVGGTPTQERKLANDLMMAGEVAVPELSGVSSTTLAASRAAPKALKAITNEQKAAQAAKDLGVTPALGMNGKVAGMTAAGLEKVPLTGGVIAKDAARAVGEVEAASARILGNVAQGRSPMEAGAVLQSGLKDFVVNFKKRASRLYDEVGKNISPDTKITAPNSVAMIREAIAPFKDNPELAAQLGVGKWAQMADGLDRGLSWEAALALRTSIGEGVGKITGAMADMDQGRLKRVYGAMTDDLEAAAKAAGPDAYKAWTRANKHYKAGADRISRSLDKTISAKEPERAFEAFSALTKGDRSTADITRMRQIKASLPRDDWNTISVSIAERLGKAKAGSQGATGDTFSPATFLTEWNKLSPDAKRILFDSDTLGELNKLARVSERVKSANLERNMSNTGTTTGLLATGAGGVTNLPATVTALATANVSARAMTSKWFLRALNNWNAGNTKALEAMASGKGAFTQDAKTILRLLSADAAQGNAANSQSRPLSAVNSN